VRASANAPAQLEFRWLLGLLGLVGFMGLLGRFEDNIAAKSVLEDASKKLCALWTTVNLVVGSVLLT
jgi:hypothetical protein